MEIIDLLRKCFGVNAVAVLLGTRKNVKSPIREQFYADGGQWPLASINVSELMGVIQNAPVVRRGTIAYAVDSGSNNITAIEPQGIDLSDLITGAELNNLRALSSESVQAYANQKMNRMMSIVQRTTEALCAQALTGKIAYPMRGANGAMDAYEIDYGMPNVLDDTDTDLSSATSIMDFYNVLDAVYQTLQDQGYGDSMTVAAGKTAFSLALKLAESSKSNILNVSIVNQGEINIGGYTVRLQSGRYKGIDGTMVPKIPDNALCAEDPTAGAQLKYLALDDIENGLQPMPFGTSTDVKKNPSVLEVVGRSKPLPIPAVGALCWAKVLPETRTETVEGKKTLVPLDEQRTMKQTLRNLRAGHYPTAQTDTGSAASTEDMEDGE